MADRRRVWLHILDPADRIPPQVGPLPAVPKPDTRMRVVPTLAGQMPFAPQVVVRKRIAQPTAVPRRVVPMSPAPWVVAVTLAGPSKVVRSLAALAWVAPSWVGPSWVGPSSDTLHQPAPPPAGPHTAVPSWDPRSAVGRLDRTTPCQGFGGAFDRGAFVPGARMAAPPQARRRWVVERPMVGRPDRLVGEFQE
jgi:hypothetical protein